MNRLLFWLASPLLCVTLICVLVIYGEDDAADTSDRIHELFGLE